MPRNDVFFDTWAWWEYLGGTQTGRHLARAYVRQPRVRIHTSILSLAEISGRLAVRDHVNRTRGTLARIDGRSTIHTVPREVVETSGSLRSELRRADPGASIIDALILATSRHVGTPLISADPAFAGQADVRSR